MWRLQLLQRHEEVWRSGEAEADLCAATVSVCKFTLQTTTVVVALSVNFVPLTSDFLLWAVPMLIDVVIIGGVCA